MPAEERLTHKNLAIWMIQRATQHGVKQEKEEEDDDDDDEAGEVLAQYESTCVHINQNGQEMTFDRFLYLYRNSESLGASVML